MTLTERKQAFTALGKFISQFASETPVKQHGIPHNELFFDGMKHQIKLAEENNSWFTKANLVFAMQSWAIALEASAIEKWLEPYDFSKVEPKTVAIIMAGNIPLVGFHDFLCVLMSGHRVLVKQSSKDKYLLPFLAKYLEYVAPGFKGNIKFTEEKLEAFDAVIATGSGNTARYFDYYFGKYPAIIRKNRNSVSILTGKESQTDLENLAEDVFRYFGLGCRNVSKLFVPQGYNFDALFQAFYSWGHLMENKKYMNNYDYNKAVFLMSLFDLTENGFLMLKEDESYASPIATLFYETYTSEAQLRQKLKTDKELIQCVVAKGLIVEEVPFGQTQTPKLWDYADGEDTLAFLLKI